MTKQLKEIYLAGGCFWGIEQYIQNIYGVEITEVGYANGTTKNPTYDDVCYNNTGHAETVHVVYDNLKTSLESLLQLYYEVVNPTSINKQGNDVGSQYRTGIYYTDLEDTHIIKKSINELQEKYDKQVVIEVKQLTSFYKAEEYHQKYLDKNPDGYCHISKEKMNNVKNIKVNKYNKPTKETLSKLTDIQYKVTQQSHTEPPFQNPYYNNFEKGIYVDITTGQPLFVSTDKFESGCGWPSFSKPIDPNVLLTKEDKKFFVKRTEVISKNSNSHLGHVFSDGPKDKGGKRYCINSASLKFIPIDKMEEEGYGYLIENVK